jgi:hypothetical protein
MSTLENLASVLLAEAPNLGGLLGADRLAKALRWRKLPRHALWYLAESLASEEPNGWMYSIVGQARRSRARAVLGVLEQAIQIVRPVLERNQCIPGFAGRLQTAPGFVTAGAELVAAARFARITTALDTMTIDPKPGGPDVQFDLGAKRVHAEVYTPKPWNEFNLVDTIRERLDKADPPARFSLIFTQPTLRDDRLAKTVAGRLMQLADDMVAGGHEVATFSGGNSGDFDVVLGKKEAVPGDRLFVGWADLDALRTGTVLMGSVGLNHVPALEEARDALSGLYQLVKGAPNVVVVDVGARLFHDHDSEAYRLATSEAGGRRPELSAVLVTGRDYRLRPAPGAEFEARAWYRVFSTTDAAIPFAEDELAMLAAPGLVLPRTG